MEDSLNATLRLRRDRLEEHRAEHDLTSESRLARAMGADRGTVNKVLNGKAKPGPDFIASLKKALPGVRFEDLWEIVPKEAA